MIDWLQRFNGVNYAVYNLKYANLYIWYNKGIIKKIRVVL